MEKIIWNDSYSVGVKKLDDQHKKIIEYIDLLTSESNLSVHSEKFHDTLHKILEYSKSHLSFEETMLYNIEYPDYDNHVKHHESFIEEIAIIAMKTVNRDPVLVKETISFLKSWWKNHILYEDMKYKEFFERLEFDSQAIPMNQ